MVSCDEGENSLYNDILNVLIFSLHDTLQYNVLSLPQATNDKAEITSHQATLHIDLDNEATFRGFKP